MLSRLYLEFNVEYPNELHKKHKELLLFSVGRMETENMTLKWKNIYSRLWKSESSIEARFENQKRYIGLLDPKKAILGSLISC